MINTEEVQVCFFTPKFANTLTITTMFPIQKLFIMSASDVSLLPLQNRLVKIHGPNVKKASKMSLVTRILVCVFIGVVGDYTSRRLQ